MTDETPSSPDNDLIVDPEPISPRLARHMRTLECPPPGDPDRALDAVDFARRAESVLDEIVEALCDDLGLDGDVTALGVSEDRNTITGARALILRRLMRRGRYSAPL